MGAGFGQLRVYVCMWSGEAVRAGTYKHGVRTWCVKEDGGPRKATSGFLADMSVAILTRPELSASAVCYCCSFTQQPILCAFRVACATGDSVFFQIETTVKRKESGPLGINKISCRNSAWPLWLCMCQSTRVLLYVFWCGTLMWVKIFVGGFVGGGCRLRTR